MSAAKNATFLFQRDFMEYHQDRFKDFSLVVYKEDTMVAVLPANKTGNKIISHGGLTYGGLLLSKKIKFQETLLVYKEILAFLASEGIKTLQLKLLPSIYNAAPSDEMEYLLFLTEAKRFRVDISSSIDLKHPVKIQSNRLEGVKKANKQGLEIKEAPDFSLFWKEILLPNLQQRHEASPVHTAEEITALAARFPQQILQFNVYQSGKIVAGATIFETQQVAHVQYISANKDKQQLGSLDFLFHYLITKRFKNKTYFDFGISNINQGKNLNKGLLYWKECFGARSIMHPFYEVNPLHHTKLDSVFL